MLPVTYAADAETLLFRTSRLAREADGRLVAFETHGLEVEPWAPGEHGTTISLSMRLSQVTGRQLTPGAADYAVVPIR